jgi:hypothetical protein
MKHNSDRWRSVVIGVIVASQLVTLLGPATVFAQEAAKPSPPPTVARGQEYYEQARFDEAITLLRGLVDRGQLQGDDLQKARELLARAYVKKGYPNQGKEVFKAMLQANSEWRPDPIRVPPDETAVFEQALKEFQGERATPPPAVSPPPTTPPATSEKPADRPAKPVKEAKPPKQPKSEPTPASSMTEGGGKKKSKVLWYVLGAAAVGGIAAAAAGGGGGGKTAGPVPLGGFPATP